MALAKYLSAAEDVKKSSVALQRMKKTLKNPDTLDS